jgi:hypothetical protein
MHCSGNQVLRLTGGSHEYDLEVFIGPDESTQTALEQSLQKLWMPIINEGGGDMRLSAFRRDKQGYWKRNRDNCTLKAKGHLTSAPAYGIRPRVAFFTHFCSRGCNVGPWNSLWLGGGNIQNTFALLATDYDHADDITIFDHKIMEQINLGAADFEYQWTTGAFKETQDMVNAVLIAGTDAAAIAAAGAAPMTRQGISLRG